jgi:DNA (cytosine-5)-methyltransferase 1
MRIISLFSGCGGLDLGFSQAGFKIVYANDFDKTVWETFERNHGITIDRRPLAEVAVDEIPDADGIVGGPPCQSWSVAGARRGMEDPRGRAFCDYVRVIKAKNPLFFCAENVPGIISSTHLSEFEKILNHFAAMGYKANVRVLDARNFGVPQSRRRVFVVGYRADLDREFGFPEQTHLEPKHSLLGETISNWVTLREALAGLPPAVPAKGTSTPNKHLEVPNHEFMKGSLSAIYMSRDRRKSWDEPSYTIPAKWRHAPLHPDSSKMRKIGVDQCEFEDDQPDFRRLSVRECARIQTFPDNFIFYYDHVGRGYRMVGNAVPVKLAEAVAIQIREDIQQAQNFQITERRAQTTF